MDEDQRLHGDGNREYGCCESAVVPALFLPAPDDASGAGTGLRRVLSVKGEIVRDLGALELAVTSRDRVGASH